jgi:hypothetical protein
MLTQTAITQLSTGSVAVVCQYTDVDTNSRHSVTAAAGLSSQLSNRTKPNQTKPNQTEPNQIKPNQTKPNQTKPNRTKPNQTLPTAAL